MKPWGDHRDSARFARAPRPAVVINAVGTRTAEIDLIDLYHNKTQILGSDRRKVDVVDSGRRLDAVKLDVLPSITTRAVDCPACRVAEVAGAVRSTA